MFMGTCFTNSYGPMSKESYSVMFMFLFNLNPIVRLFGSNLELQTKKNSTCIGLSGYEIPAVIKIF